MWFEYEKMFFNQNVWHSNDIHENFVFLFDYLFIYLFIFLSIYLF